MTEPGGNKVARTARIVIVVSCVAAFDGFALWWGWLERGWIAFAGVGVVLAVITATVLLTVIEGPP